MAFVAPENKTNSQTTSPKTGGFVAPENQGLKPVIEDKVTDIQPTSERVDDIPLVTIEEEPVKNPIQQLVENISTPASQRDVKDYFKLNLFGSNIVLPRINAPVESTAPENSPTYQGLFSANRKELGISELPDLSLQGLYNTKKVADKTLQEIDVLNNSTPDEISDFVQLKKQNISKLSDIDKQSVDLSGKYHIEGVGRNSNAARVAGERNAELSDIDREYSRINSELDAVAKNAAFKNSPVMSNEIDTYLTKSNQDIISVAQQVGNNIQNITDQTNRSTFQAKHSLDEQFGGYSQSYKDQLAYVGIQSEIYNTQNQLQQDNQVVAEKLSEINDLSEMIKTNPNDKGLVADIQAKVAELGPLKDNIDKKKQFITRLSEATLDLPEMDKKISYQNKINQDFET